MQGTFRGSPVLRTVFHHPHTIGIRPTILLFDNGSLRPEPTLRLRIQASALAARLDRKVIPLSLLHADRIDPARMGDAPARLLEAELVRRLARGERHFILLPYFIAPGSALSDFLSARLRPLRKRYRDLEVGMADSLARLGRGSDLRLARILTDQINRTLDGSNPARLPAVIVLDHGSPTRAVTEIRNCIADATGRALGSRVTGVIAASMERREGPAYAFNEPLLDDALMRARGQSDTIVVGPLFLAPGRHAGPLGDIESICRQVETKHPGTKIRMAGLVGEHPGIIDILEDRVREVEGRGHPVSSYA